MFQNYKEIFERRGEGYQQAMMNYPQAREEEFKQVIDLAEIEKEHTIGDIPAGGGYLANFLPLHEVISVEISPQFSKYLNSQAVVSEHLNNIPLVTGSLDRVISLAGVHHLDNKLVFYQEVYRLLKKEGIFILADGAEQSQVAKFLNEFVDQYNPQGHQGKFLSNNTTKELETVGFKVVKKISIKLFWKFENQESMVNFCKLLFGLELARREQILAGLEDYLGYIVRENTYYLHWKLLFYKCQK